MNRVAPQLYDLDPREHLRSDLEFFSRHICASARVLDVGAGTGRISFHLARMGCSVLGVERDPVMLSHAIAKLFACPEISGEGEVKLVGKDVLHVDVQEQFDAIVFGHRTFACFLEPESQRRALRLVARCLREQGQAFVTLPLEMSAPSRDWEGRTSYDWEIRRPDGWVLSRKTLRDRLDVEQKIHHLRLLYEARDSNGVVFAVEEPLRVAHITANDFRVAADESGLDVAQAYGGYGGEALGDGSEMVFMLRRKDSVFESRGALSGLRANED